MSSSSSSSCSTLSLRDRMNHHRHHHTHTHTHTHHHTAHRYTQVISDVDDTLKSSGGVNIGGVALGGVDTQYRRGEVYPGVAMFYYQLSRHPVTGIAPKVAILSARAEEFKSLLELKDSSPVAQALIAAATKATNATTATAKNANAVSAKNDAFGIHHHWGLGPVLYGSVAEWIAQDRKGLRKFSNFERLLSQDPSGTIMQYIYVGDTGEMDAVAGEAMLREYPQCVLAVFLHVVVRNHSSDRPNPILLMPPTKLIHGRPVIYFRTYIGAAVAAVELELLSVDGLRAVIESVCEQLRDVPQTSDKWTDVHKDLVEARRIIQLMEG